MLIQTVETPNQNSLKFVLPMDITEPFETFFFQKGDQTNSFLANTILEMNRSVFFGKNFITVTKFDEKNWSELKPIIIDEINKFFSKNTSLFHNENIEEKKTTLKHTDPTVIEICKILDERIRPAVAQDGGDIIFDAFEDGVVYLKMMGACSGCPKSTLTLKNGIENMLRHYIPEVLEVRSAL